ncbi:MAG: hypothetical protein MK188_05060 [Gammaproteobacteria bacterium]|nr:hypothetical protein [Gammaproteobacteria bacterium]
MIATNHKLSLGLVKKLAIRWLGLVSLVILAGCSTKVTVDADIPRPLVEKVPLNVHVKFTDEFRNHVYEENEKKRSLSSLDLAQAQMQMFSAVFSTLTNLVSADDPSKDLTVVPEVLDFQYTAPNETKLKQYEIFLKYRIKLLKSDDSSLADWVVKGYGKTPTALLTSAPQAFNSAANVALRDVGAQLATRFPGQRKIKAMIASKTEQKEQAPLAASVENQQENGYAQQTEGNQDD